MCLEFLDRATFRSRSRSAPGLADGCKRSYGTGKSMRRIAA
jgi:hypothetical protein